MGENSYSQLTQCVQLSVFQGQTAAYLSMHADGFHWRSEQLPLSVGVHQSHCILEDMTMLKDPVPS